MKRKNKITCFLRASLILVCAFCIAVFAFLIKYIEGENTKTIDQVGQIRLRCQ